MKKGTPIFDAVLPVTLKGTGCVWCPALRYRMADETRYCSERGSILEDYKNKRLDDCPLLAVNKRD